MTAAEESVTLHAKICQKIHYCFNRSWKL